MFQTVQRSLEVVIAAWKRADHLAIELLLFVSASVRRLFGHGRPTYAADVDADNVTSAAQAARN